MPILYQATNLINGKRYIGVTATALAVRRHKHFWNASHGMRGKFYAAIRAYGAEFFKFSVLKECPDIAVARMEERRLIAALVPEYNLTAGGEGVWGHRHSEESKRKMSAAKKGKPAAWMSGPNADAVRAKIDRYWGAMSPDERRQMIARAVEARAARGNEGPLSQQQLDSLRKNIGRAIEARRRRVICLVSGRRFHSVTAAAQVFGITAGQVSRACKTGKTMRRGHRFGYEEQADGATK